jgi:glutamate synthase domain-containing protein 2
MDGGIQRGTDMVKAFCLGARAVLCGRAYAYGLAAAGEAGVARAGNPAGGCGTHSEAARVPIGATLDRSYVELAARFWPAHS